jgi:glycosyltransferase involved in cell wall biosynthesis
MPAAEGNGLAMRAGVFLEAYARRFDITLAVLPIAMAGSGFSDSGFLRRHARRVEILPLAPLLHPHFRLIARLGDSAERRAALARYALPQLCPYDAVAAGEMLRSRLDETGFDAMHVERLYLAPLADAIPRPGHAILDLDEDDGSTHRSIGRLHALNGEAAEAAAAIQQAEKLDRLKHDFLPRFDLVMTAAPGEAAALAEEFPRCRFAVVANAFCSSFGLPASPGPAKGIDYLMVGNLAYYPNADGARFLCREVLPYIRRAGGRARIVLAGHEPGAEIRALATLPEVSVQASPTDLAPLYADAAVAVVPIRAGGGSRIKILEAFAHGVPVVSTSAGAAGLEAIDGRHLLIADGPEDFAAAALRLRRDPVLATAVAAEGLALFESRYRFEKAAAGILALVDSLAPI